MTRFRLMFSCTFAALAGCVPVAAQQVAEYVPPPASGQGFELSIESIMQAEANVGQAPTQVRWTDDSRWIYFQRQPGGLEWDAGRSLYLMPAEGGEPERIGEVEATRLAPLLAGGDLSRDRTRRVTPVDGDLYLIVRSSLDVRRLTHTEEVESDPLFSDDGASVLFQRSGGLYRLGLDGGELTQLTRIESGPAEEDEEAEGRR